MKKIPRSFQNFPFAEMRPFFICVSLLVDTHRIHKKIGSTSAANSKSFLIKHNEVSYICHSYGSFSSSFPFHESESVIFK